MTTHQGRDVRTTRQLRGEHHATVGARRADGAHRGRERLALLEANQEEIADGLHAVARNLSIIAVVLALAVGAASLGLGFLI